MAIDSTISQPMPGKENTVSTSTDPARTNPNCRATTAMMGSSALRSAWRTTITRSRTPLARAVRI